MSEDTQPKKRDWGGGARKGAGRKAGGQNRKTKLRLARAERAIEKIGITPLEVMLEAMRRAYESGDIDKAAGIAKDAAPYVHPKLQPVDGKGSSDVVVNNNITVRFA